MFSNEPHVGWSGRMLPAVHVLSSAALGINCVDSLSAVKQHSCFQMCKAFLGHCGSLPVERFLSVYTTHPGRQPRNRLVLMDLGPFNISAITLHNSVETAAAERVQLLSRASVTAIIYQRLREQTADRKRWSFEWHAAVHRFGMCVLWVGFYPMIFLTLSGSFGISAAPHPGTLIITQC